MSRVDDYAILYVYASFDDEPSFICDYSFSCATNARIISINQSFFTHGPLCLKAKSCCLIKSHLLIFFLLSCENHYEQIYKCYL